jgi:hypothetical protein
MIFCKNYNIQKIIKNNGNINLSLTYITYNIHLYIKITYPSKPYYICSRYSRFLFDKLINIYTNAYINNNKNKTKIKYVIITT